MLCPDRSMSQHSLRCHASIVHTEGGIAGQHDPAHSLGESAGPTLRPLCIRIDEVVGDGLRLNERIGHNATVEIVAGANAESGGLVRKQGVIGNEEERAGIGARAIMTSPKIIALEPGNGSGVCIEHDFLVRSQTASQLREVNHDAAWLDPSARALLRRRRRPSDIGGRDEAHSVSLSSGGLMCRNEYSSETS